MKTEKKRGFLWANKTAATGVLILKSIPKHEKRGMDEALIV